MVDQHGQPLILRQLFAESGVTQTIVWNDDGSHWAFGERTVTSLLDNNVDQTNAWVASLSDRQLHGLVHELARRFVEGSQRRKQRQVDDETQRVSSSYDFFGLREEATDKELDNAYRRLARAMHPDKNGGTDEAKEAFQAMKERYELLKEHRAGGLGRGGPGGEDDGRADGESEASGQAQQQQQQPTCISYDPSDRQSLHQAASEFVRQLHVLQQDTSCMHQQAGKGGA